MRIFFLTTTISLMLGIACLIALANPAPLGRAIHGHHAGFAVRSDRDLFGLIKDRNEAKPVVAPQAVLWGNGAGKAVSRLTTPN